LKHIVKNEYAELATASGVLLVFVLP